MNTDSNNRAGCIKKRLPYIASAVILLTVEIYIGICVHDRIIRPYGGDVLVTVLLCCAARCVSPDKPKGITVYAFSAAIITELLQLVRPDRLLKLQGTVVGIIMGSSFSLIDIGCYFAGCILFGVAEYIFKSAARHTHNR